MKHLFLVLISALLLSIKVFGQTQDVTLFLGEPVDGSKAEMISKLEKKGYTYDASIDMLKGTFNGYPSLIVVHTNNDVVDRIVVFDEPYSSETDIKIRFNKLYNQFANNKKYSTLEDYRIPEDESISYEMGVKNKRYQSVHYQKCTTEIDSTVIEKMVSVLSEYDKDIYNKLQTMDEEERLEALSYAYKAMAEFNKQVWFMIDKSYQGYKICIFYDNMYNQSNGEDL